MNGFVLKTIACVAMLVDHAAVVFGAALPTGVYWAMRGVGRLAFPIFCFFIAEGFVRTKSRGRYALRLALFALISEIPFDLVASGRVMNLSGQNVYLTLLLGLLGLWGHDALAKRGITVAAALPPLVCALAAQLTGADYGAGGVLLIFVIHLCAANKIWQGVGVLLVTSALARAFHPIQMVGVLGWVLCLGYNGRRGPRAKYLMYAFYPLHLLGLWLLGVWI
ncbi:MAG: hypothetical protein J6R33_03940 [Clostridia bacterium]|nr:hypothetical protein [Clostridia bacterium]